MLVAMLYLVERDFFPLKMRKDKRCVVAHTVSQFADHVDNKFVPLDEHMHEFVEVLRAYIFGILVQLSSQATLQLVQDALKQRKLDEMLAMDKKDATFTDCPITHITVLQAILICLSIIKPAASMKVSPARPLPLKKLEFLRLANSMVHVLLFAKFTRERKIGVLCFVSLVKQVEPGRNSFFLQKAYDYI